MIRADIAQPLLRGSFGAPQSLLAKALLFWFGASPALGLLQVAGLNHRSELSPATKKPRGQPPARLGAGARPGAGAQPLSGQDSKLHFQRCHMGVNGIGKWFGIGRYAATG